MPKIKGKWRWDIGVEDIIADYVRIDEQISFVSNGEEYVKLIKEQHGAGIKISYVRKNDTEQVFMDDFLGEAPRFEESLRIMDFGYIEQEVSEEFYNFIDSYATHLEPTISDKLTWIAANEQKVYDAGYEKGKSEGDSYYDTFWDTFQSNGKRRYYEKAFADTTNGGRMWVYGKSYKPKYPMKPLQATSMFEYGSLPYAAIAAIDFSECLDFLSTFAYFRIAGDDNRVFPPIDVSSATRTQNMFGWASEIYEIEKITVKKTSVLNSMFNGATSIREVRFEGEIGTPFAMSGCKQLSRASIENIIACLSDSTTGLKVTFSKAAVDKAFETSEGANDGSNSNVWLDDKLGYRPNWTIALA